MTPLAANRKRLGFSQESLAHILGVTRSQWAMAECGQRYLPSSALIKLSQMVRDFDARTEI